MQEGFSQERRLVKTSTPGVYKRGSRYVVVFRDPQGKQRKRAARTLAEARALKSGLNADVDRGEYRTVSQVTFAGYAAEWVDSYLGRTTRGVRPETRLSYKQALERDAIPFFGRTRLASVAPVDVKRFAASLAGRGMKPASVRRSLAPVRALFATAFEDGLIRADPAARVRIVQAAPVDDEGDRQVKALSEDELRAVLAELPEGWRPFFELLAHTGLRVSEAIALSWSDINLGERRLHVTRRLYRGRFDAPKSSYGRRTIRLSEGLARTLWRLRGARPDETLVFSSGRGTPLDPSNLADRVLKPAAAKAGVGWVGFHTFRHTCATMLFRHGLNAKQVQLWLGHHSPAFTLARYVHLLPDDLPEPSFLDEVTGGSPVPVPSTLDIELTSAAVSS